MTTTNKVNLIEEYAKLNAEYRAVSEVKQTTADEQEFYNASISSTKLFDKIKKVERILKRDYDLDMYAISFDSFLHPVV